jgi:acyl-CoA reductase-like NAD-dependent aldehyde dehydrogenase
VCKPPQSAPLSALLLAEIVADIFPEGVFSDVEAAAQAAARGMNFAWAGQSCGSTSRLLVHESVADRVLERILDLIREVRIGPPSEESTQMGLPASQLQLDRVVRLNTASAQ